MNIFRKMNVTVVFLALMIIILGLHVAFTGTVKGALVFGDERYVVRGLTIVGGLYFLFLGLRNKSNKNGQK